MIYRQLSLVFIILSIVVYWVRFVIYDDQDSEQILVAAVMASGGSMFFGLFFSIFTFKTFGEAIGGLFGLWIHYINWKNRKMKQDENE